MSMDYDEPSYEPGYKYGYEYEYQHVYEAGYATNCFHGHKPRLGHVIGYSVVIIGDGNVLVCCGN